MVRGYGKTVLNAVHPAGTELRAMFFLVVSFVFFLIIICALGLGTIMGSGRLSERTRGAGSPALFMTVSREMAACFTRLA